MIKRNRKGVIGFLLTMAVGVALGAAALVVSTEMQKENSSDLLKAASVPSSPAAVEKAFADYQEAYKAYQQAAGLGRRDIQKYADAYEQAKRRLEIELFRNTPGVSEMDMEKFRSQETTQERVEPQGSPDEQGALNPFSEAPISLTGSNEQARPAVAPVQPQVQNEAGTPASAPEPDNTAAPSDSQITGMDYYRVKSGDSLSKICQRYYGDSGMWSHILKYQIPSIAATPNLIFPGQLIALPRGFSKAKDETSHISQDSPTTNDTADPAPSHEVAPAGDESWQTRFQKDYLISDRSLTNVNTMTVAGIQRFLESKNSCLARPYNGSTPAQMIYNAARKYGINPQVLLCRLQCEQGLISKTSATQRQLDWALGVGCYDSGNWNQKFKGLDKQIEFAAATYRRHYDNARQRINNGERITMTIDGQSVNIRNAASYAFYKYCPHFQGNKLFYDVWNGYKRSF